MPFNSTQVLTMMDAECHGPLSTYKGGLTQPVYLYVTPWSVSWRHSFRKGSRIRWPHQRWDIGQKHLANVIKLASFTKCNQLSGTYLIPWNYRYDLYCSCYNSIYAESVRKITDATSKKFQRAWFVVSILLMYAYSLNQLGGTKFKHLRIACIPNVRW